MQVFHDQLNRAVNLPAIPQRIVSIVPSQTELLFYLDLDQQIVGVTKFCIHPKEKVKLTTKVGGTKQLDLELIKSLKPDLVIANKEENERSQVEALMDVCPVWISDIDNLEGALLMIQSVGVITGKATEARDLCLNITRGFENFPLPGLNLSVAYFIWRKPYMVAGAETYINNILKLCGFENAICANRYPEVTPADVIQANPDIILLSSEPYPFKQKHIDEFKQLLPHAKVILADGEIFSWYGSRLLQVPGYLTNLVKLI